MLMTSNVPWEWNELLLNYGNDDDYDDYPEIERRKERAKRAARVLRIVTDEDMYSDDRDRGYDNDER